MKKPIVVAMVLLLTLTILGCAGAVTEPETGSQEIAFDFDVLTQKLAEATYQDSELGEQPLFGDINVMDESAVNDYLQIDTTDFEEMYCARHSDETKASLVLVIKPKEGAEDNVKSIMHTFLDMYAAQYSTYFPPSVKMIEDCYTINKGDYIIYTISDDNQAVINAINQSKK